MGLEHAKNVFDLWQIIPEIAKKRGQYEKEY